MVFVQLILLCTEVSVSLKNTHPRDLSHRAKQILSLTFQCVLPNDDVRHLRWMCFPQAPAG